MKVFTIERQHALHLKSRDLLEEMRIPARCFYGDGYAGKSAFAPFDKILVTCGAPKIPDALKQQLKVGGRMVIPVGEVNSVQHMLTIDKVSETEYVTEEHGNFQFVPMLERTDNAD